MLQQSLCIVAMRIVCFHPLWRSQGFLFTQLPRMYRLHPTLVPSQFKSPVKWIETWNDSSLTAFDIFSKSCFFSIFAWSCLIYVSVGREFVRMGRRREVEALQARSLRIKFHYWPFTQNGIRTFNLMAKFNLELSFSICCQYCRHTLFSQFFKSHIVVVPSTNSLRTEEILNCMLQKLGRMASPNLNDISHCFWLYCSDISQQ